MDILSSQANLAGYQAVIDAAVHFDRAFPMMMTAAGTVRPAKAFVMGAGVAGLQAIATARRLGAVVTATDVRAAAGEQVESLGAKFIMTDALKDASGTGGYARELTKDEQAAQAELVAGHIAKQDIVITTALIPGRPAPKLVSRAMVESMAPGSVIVDLAAERGGNVELTVPGQVITTPNGVTIIGYTNVAGRLASSASQLYARNLYAFIETLFDKKSKEFSINWDDELIKATVLTRAGAVVHPNLVAAAAAIGSDAAPSRATKQAGRAPAKPKSTGQPEIKPESPAAAAVDLAPPAFVAEPGPPAKVSRRPASAVAVPKSAAVPKAKPASTPKVSPAASRAKAAAKPAAADKPAAKPPAKRAPSSKTSKTPKTPESGA
jgi:NAD(P) transhydrogenase subunit alpha